MIWLTSTLISALGAAGSQVLLCLTNAMISFQGIVSGATLSPFPSNWTLLSVRSMENAITTHFSLFLHIQEHNQH